MHREGIILMTIQEMQNRKTELGYTNEQIAKLSGLPLGTVQKIFAGTTKAPRRATILALEKLLGKKSAPDSFADSTERSGAPADGYPESSDLPSDILKENSAVYSAAEPLHTLEDYLALPDERRVELIDGVFYDMASPMKIHQAILLRLATMLTPCVDAHPECELFMAPSDVVLDNDAYTVVQPDLYIVCNEKDFNKLRFYGAPDFITEILSPSSRYNDQFRKLSKYRLAGVREYWIIDPEKLKITVYDLEHEELPETYTFSDTVPVLISDGECAVDFSKILEKIRRYL